jgi:hypothetical protein
MGVGEGGGAAGARLVQQSRPHLTVHESLQQQNTPKSAGLVFSDKGKTDVTHPPEMSLKQGAFTYGSESWADANVLCLGLQRPSTGCTWITYTTIFERMKVGRRADVGSCLAWW